MEKEKTNLEKAVANIQIDNQKPSKKALNIIKKALEENRNNSFIASLYEGVKNGKTKK